MILRQRWFGYTTLESACIWLSYLCARCRTSRWQEDPKMESFRTSWSLSRVLRCSFIPSSARFERWNGKDTPTIICDFWQQVCYFPFVAKGSASCHTVGKHFLSGALMLSWHGLWYARARTDQEASQPPTPFLPVNHKVGSPTGDSEGDLANNSSNQEVIFPIGDQRENWLTPFLKTILNFLLMVQRELQRESLNLPTQFRLHVLAKT